MNYTKSLCLLLACFIWVTESQAKVKNRLKRSDIGFTAGASFGIPAGKIPKGSTGLPLPAPMLGLSYEQHITPRWSIKYGVETYAMKARFETTYEDFIFSGNLGEHINVPGYDFSDSEGSIPLDRATVEGGLFNNRYISVPVSAQHYFRKGWSVSMGTYVAYNIKKLMKGTAIDILIHTGHEPLSVDYPMPFDESHQIRDWDFGLNVGGNYELKSGVNFDLRVNAGMIDFFVKDFTAPPSAYRNIVVQTTVGYKIGGGYRRM